MKLKDIIIRAVDPVREKGILSYGCNYAAVWMGYEYYYAQKPTKHQAREDLIRTILG